MLSYEILLSRAQAEIAQLKSIVEDLKNQNFELSTLANRITILDYKAFHAQRKDLFIKIYLLEADLQRCRGYAAILRKDIAAGRVREAVAVAQAA